MPNPRVFSTSVPAHDADLVAELFPETGTTQASVQDSQPPPGTRVLTLTIHDRLDPAHLDALPALDGVVSWADGLEDLLRRSDALSLHVPLTPGTRGLLDRRRLALLRPGAVLVNTARGDVVDQRAVEEALRAGRLAGYAADVLPGEPEPADLDRFRDLPNVLLSPHLGAHNTATLRRRYEATAAIARAVLAGRAGDVAAYRVDATAST